MPVFPAVLEGRDGLVIRSTTKSPWYTDGLRFTCTQCGRCCGGAPGYVWVSPEEVEVIAELLGMPLEQFARQHTRRAGTRVSLLELDDGDCEFLIREPGGKTRCEIHPARPLQCRTWPFWTSNLSSRRAWLASAARCPGMDQGEHHPLPVIQDALRRTEDADLPL